MKKPNLENATIIEDIDVDSIPGLSDKFKAYLKIQGNKEFGTETGEFGINAIFTLSKYEYKYNSDGFACSHNNSTKDWISIFKLSGGANNLWSFEKDGCEKSDDYDSIPSSRLLFIPTNHAKAIEYLERNCIGKTLRVVARSADKCTQYGGRYYLFVIE